jgi:myo-inositol-1(or 4)-monophosphatase
MHALLNVAVLAARRAGSTLIKMMANIEKLKVEKKGFNDYVSEADLASERTVIDCIHKHYPDHAIQTEESGNLGESETVWIIDPLDGTTNFLHGFPVFAVSIAVPYLDDRRIRVSGQTKLERALIGTGFPFRQADVETEPYMAMFTKILRHTSGIRRPGAAALDLAYVAAGRLDAFWETGLRSWDLAAGTVLIREAGGIISGLDGSENFLDTGHVLTGSPRIYREIAKLCPAEIKALTQ